MEISSLIYQLENEFGKVELQVTEGDPDQQFLTRYDIKLCNVTVITVYKTKNSKIYSDILELCENVSNEEKDYIEKRLNKLLVYKRKLKDSIPIQIIELEKLGKRLLENNESIKPIIVDSKAYIRAGNTNIFVGVIKTSNSYSTIKQALKCGETIHYSVGFIKRMTE